MLHDLGPWLFTALYVLNRWIHDIATTLLVGGVLFLEFIVPLATKDLKEEQRAAVFGRARWVFQKVVWVSAILLLLSGGVSAQRMWHTYSLDSKQAGSWYMGSMPWAIAHSALAVIGILMAFRVTAGRRLLERPVGWLRITLAVLLICVFIAVVTRFVRLQSHEWREFPERVRSHEV